MKMQPTAMQDQLVEYLTRGIIRPEEFLFYLPEFMLDHGISEHDVARVLSNEKLSKKFVKWIKKNNIEERWFGEEMSIAKLAPPRLVFEDPEAMPAGSWVLHHTPSAKRFFSFKYGCLGSRLAYAWYTDRVEIPTDNLSTDLDASNRVWVFGFRPDPDDDICVGPEGEFQCVSESGWVAHYGKDALLFKTDAAVVAFHEGDQEHQVMAPGGTEYNTAWLQGQEDGTWKVWLPRQKKPFGTFETFDAITSALDDAYEDVTE